MLLGSRLFADDVGKGKYNLLRRAVSSVGAGKEEGGSGMLENTVQPSWCCGPNYAKQQ